MFYYPPSYPKKNPQGQMGGGGANPQMMGGPPNVQVANTDPMMALRTMANQGTQPNLASMIGGGPSDPMMNPGSQQPGGNMNPAGGPQGVGPGGGGPPPMGGATGGGLNPLAMQQPRSVQMGGPMMGGPRGGMQQGPPNVLMGGTRMRGPMMQQQGPGMMPQQGPMGNQMAGQSPSPMGASMGGQMVPSPAGYAPSPGGGAAGGGGGNAPPSNTSALHVNSPGFLNRTPGAPSPGQPLNTPVNPMSVASPAAGSQGGSTQSAQQHSEDQAYLEKLKQLSKYIDPLRRMIARIDKDEDRKKELSKLKNLLDILSDPKRRCPMETLLKCEQVLERLDLKVRTADSLAGAVPSVSSLARLQQEHNIWQPLLESISNNMKSPMFNHTLNRVFGPTVALLIGPSYRPPSPSQPVEDVGVSSSGRHQEIPDVLQGEIAHLDQRFKVQLDPVQHSGSRTVHLICQLDDKNLPCVPPISIGVPFDYPDVPPQCDLNVDQYNTTPFLRNVLDSLNKHMAKMPLQFSVTSLLDTWEMCVRQACAHPQPEIEA